MSVNFMCACMLQLHIVFMFFVSADKNTHTQTHQSICKFEHACQLESHGLGFANDRTVFPHESMCSECIYITQKLQVEFYEYVPVTLPYCEARRNLSEKEIKTNNKPYYDAMN